jgi:N-acetylneuraminic acid mutarotase
MGGTSGSAGSAGSNAAGGAITGEATERAIASLPADRQEHSVAAANGEVFVLGGYAPNATAGVIAYNPENDSWRNVADFIGPFNHANAASVGEKLYVAGFYEAGTMSQASAQTFVYDPVADDWSELAPMPADTNRAASCVAVLGTRIYIFGGARDNAVVADASYYDTAADSWTELPPLPEAREHCTAGAIGEKLYVGGGRTHTITQLLPKTWEFDPVAETYLEKAAILTPRGGSAGAVLGGRLFVFGGEGNPDSQAGVFGEIEGYDPVTDSWESFAPLAVPRHGFGAAVLDGRIYLPGGANRQGGAAHDAASVFFFE